MKAIALALLLSQQPVELQTVLFAAEPPPETVIKATWRWQGEDTPIWVLSEPQAKLTAARIEECQRELVEAQVQAAEPRVPRWTFVLVGVAVGASAAWFTAGAVR